LFVAFLFASSTFAVVGEAGAGAGAEASGAASIPLFSSIFRFFLLLFFLGEEEKNAVL
jgi:hypothetical protein